MSIPENEATRPKQHSSGIEVRWDDNPIDGVIRVLIRKDSGISRKAIILEVPEEGLYSDIPVGCRPPAHWIRGASGDYSRENDSLSQAIELMREATYLLDAAEVPEVRQAIHDLIRDLRKSLRPQELRYELAVAWAHEDSGPWEAGHFFNARSEAEAHAMFEADLTEAGRPYCQIWTYAVQTPDEIEEDDPS